MWNTEDQARWQTAAERAWRNPSSLRCLSFQTQLGRWFKGGQELSGGEWQKIALPSFYANRGRYLGARPTAAMDAEAEVHLRALSRAHSEPDGL